MLVVFLLVSFSFLHRHADEEDNDDRDDDDMFLCISQYLSRAWACPIWSLVTT